MNNKSQSMHAIVQYHVVCKAETITCYRLWFESMHRSRSPLPRLRCRKPYRHVASAFVEEVLVPIEGDVRKMQLKLIDALRELNRKRQNAAALRRDINRMRTERGTLRKRCDNHKLDLERNRHRHNEQLRDREVMALRVKSEHDAVVTALQRKCVDYDRVREKLDAANRELADASREKDTYKISLRKKLKSKLESHIRSVSNTLDLTSLTDSDTERMGPDASAPSTDIVPPPNTSHGSDDDVGAVVSAATTDLTKNDTSPAPKASHESNDGDTTEQMSAGDYESSSSDTE